MRQLFAHLTPNVLGGPLELTTVELVKPGIPIQEREADEFRQLGMPPNTSGALKVYLELFDPIVVLLQQRLSEGERGNFAAATHTEQLFTALYDEQGQAATQAGLSGCTESPVEAVLNH
jgi:hypothetical protein